MTCRISEPPVISISPETDPIKYDISKTSEQLSALKTNTISPYGLDVDTATGGMRRDKANIEYVIKYHILTNNVGQTSCMSYANIDLKIQLRPKIYIAQEYNTGECGKMVLGHEKKHVTTDRWVTNKYSKKLGKAIQHTVNSVKVVGPFPSNRKAEVQTLMKERIKQTVNNVMTQMNQEMSIRQKHVDSLEEYERVSQYCKNSAAMVFKKRQEKK